MLHYTFPNYREYETLTEAVGQGLVIILWMDYLMVSCMGNNPSTDGTNYLYTQSDLVQLTQVYWKSQERLVN